MKVHKIIFVVFLLFGSLFANVSCSDDDSLLLVMEYSNIYLNPGSSTVVNITSGNGNYRAKSNNLDIAEAKVLDKNSIEISLKREGSAIITVRDEMNMEAQILVRTLSIDGIWWLSSYGAKIDVDHDEVKEEIENDVIENVDIPPISAQEGTLFVFTPDGKVELYVSSLASNNNNTRKNGTYEKNDDHIILKFPEKEMYYKMAIQDYNNMTFEEDISEAFKKLYPDAGVNKVIRVHKLTRKIDLLY